MIKASEVRDTRERLLDEGVAAFLANGYHGTGLKQVLDRADIPKGSFYNYFGSKEEFGAATIRHFAAGVGAMFSRAMEESPDPASGLRAFFRALMDQFRDDGFVGGCLLGNLGGELEGSDVCRDALAGSLHALWGEIRDALGAAQEQGLVRGDRDAGEMADLLIAAWEGGVICMKIVRRLEPLEKCVDMLLDDYFRP